MSVLKSNDGKELIVTCKCGCDSGVHIQIVREYENINPEDELYCYINYLSNNWYQNQGKTIYYVIKDKLQKIWAIIRNKDYRYSEVLMSRKDFETFREYINEVDGSNE